MQGAPCIAQLKIRLFETFMHGALQAFYTLIMRMFMGDKMPLR